MVPSIVNSLQSNFSICGALLFKLKKYTKLATKQVINKIDKVLFIISPRFLYDQKAIQGLEN